ncbi:c-type cytochrome biogenesis protein CcmI [Yoonia sp. 208BN28-4]|uniref:c-type cytochrome biogenesis protein CcmI n=1 Tax=Yoonia sp. 208BN28-4 TaxID=3126505 RepID=UPI0030A7D587
MLFWTICGILTLLVALVVAGPMLRKPTPATSESDVAFYKAQLAEVDRDVARDLLAPDEAEAARTEIARRLLASQRTDAVDGDAGRGRAGAVFAAGTVIVLSLVTYQQLGAPSYPDLPLGLRLANSDEARANRPSQAQAEAAAPAPPAVDAAEEYLRTVQQLRQIVPQRPDDLQGWVLLAQHEAALNNFAAAAQAQARVVALKGDEATLSDQMVQVDMMVAAANGFVSPEAEDLIRGILAVDEANIPARYYLGSLYNQTDRPDIAFRIWRDIVENGPSDLFHVAFAREQIEDAAFRAGTDYALPEQTGPSAADVANMQDLPPEDQQQMIAGMVEGLADRLAEQGGPPADWARLITAYGVLGQTDTARAIWTEARDVFGASPTALATIDAAAERAGLSE